MKNFNVYGGVGKVPTGTYIDHTHESPKYNSYPFIKNIKWVFDGLAQDNFYIDEELVTAFQHGPSIKKYGWLLESKVVIPQVYEHFLENIDVYMNVYELVFTSDRSIYLMHDRIKFVPANTLWVKDLNIYNKTKLLSMICSNNQLTEGHRDRLQWVNKLTGVADIYGRGINPISRKEDGLIDYMFSVAIENSSYASYFTEKILDCFATGTIPIYKGSPDIGNFFNKEGIIILDDNFDFSTLNNDLYYSKMDAIKDNFERVKEYIVLENYIYDRYLK
jgi:hypothetical protein